MDKSMIWSMEREKLEDSKIGRGKVGVRGGGGGEKRE